MLFQQHVHTIKIYNQVQTKKCPMFKKVSPNMSKVRIVFHVSDLHLKQKPRNTHTPGNSARCSDPFGIVET